MTATSEFALIPQMREKDLPLRSARANWLLLLQATILSHQSSLLGLIAIDGAWAASVACEHRKPFGRFTLRR